MDRPSAKYPGVPSACRPRAARMTRAVGGEGEATAGRHPAHAGGGELGERWCLGQGEDVHRRADGYDAAICVRVGEAGGVEAVGSASR